MPKTRLSLFYLAFYLYLGGAALVASPKLALVLFKSSGDYSDLMPRLVGMLLLGLAIMISQIIRHRASIIYPTTLLVGALILFGFANFYFEYKDPMLLVLMGIVGFGVVLTLGGYYVDRRDKVSWPRR